MWVHGKTGEGAYLGCGVVSEDLESCAGRRARQRSPSPANVVLSWVAPCVQVLWQHVHRAMQGNLSTVDTTGTQLAVLYTGETLYRGHHWDPAGCPVYRGTSLQWTPLAPSWLSCIQWNLSIEDTTGTQLAVLYTVELLYRGHHWDPAGCPVYSGTSHRGHYWDPAGCPVYSGTSQ